MLKKLLSVALSLVMMLSAISVPVMADRNNILYEQIYDTNSVTTSGNRIYTGGIAGKSETDISFNNNNDSDYGYLNDVVISKTEKTTMEFNHYRKSTSGLCLFRDSSTNQLEVFRIATKYVQKDTSEYSGEISVPAGKWNKVAVVFDIPNKKFYVYYNDVNVRESGFTMTDDFINAVSNSKTTFRIQTTGLNDYIDDVKTYSGDYEGIITPTVSGSGDTVVNTSAKTIEMPVKDVTVAAQNLAVTNGSFSGVVNSSDNMTRTSGDIADGDLFAFKATDDSYHYYTYRSPEPVQSETEPLTNDFSASTASGNVIVENSMGGKNSADKSLYISASGDIHEFNHTLVGDTVIEYNLFSTAASRYTQFRIGSTNEQFLSIRPDGSNYGLYNNGIVKTLAYGRWYRVAYELKLSGATPTYNIYIDGQKIVSDIKINYPAFIGDKGVTYKIEANQHYIDDLKVYAGSYTAPTASTLTTADPTIIIDQSNKTIKMDPIDISLLSTKFTPVSGTIAGVTGADGITKTSGSLVGNDKIALLANDGVSYSYYTVYEAPKTASFTQNFNSVDDGPYTSWYQIIENKEFITTGSYASDLMGGKQSGDKSVYITAGDYYGKAATFYGKTTVEFSMLRDIRNNFNFGPGGANKTLNFADKILTGGSNEELQNAVGSYELGKWYRVAIVYDATNTAAPVYDAYINGTKIVDNEPYTLGDDDYSFAVGSERQYRIGAEGWIDDVMFYDGDYKGATPVTLSTTDCYTVKNDKLIFKNLSAGLNVTDIHPDAVLVDPVSYKTVTRKVQAGDFVAMVTQDGLVFNYYTVIDGENWSDIAILKDDVLYTGASLEAGEYVAEVTVTGPTSYNLIIAKYKDNTLTDIKVKAIIPDAGDNYVDGVFKTEPIEVTSPQTEKVKAFFWKTDYTPVHATTINPAGNF